MLQRRTFYRSSERGAAASLTPFSLSLRGEITQRTDVRDSDDGEEIEGKILIC